MITNERRLPCFKAYDIRGRVPDELNEAVAYRIGQAFVELRRPARMVVGHDMRLSSRGLADALIEGIVSKGVDVVDIGMCGTEMVYFATAFLGTDHPVNSDPHSVKSRNIVSIITSGEPMGSNHRF
jgi:phosphomannomutase